MADKISKKIKFALFLKNGEEVRTLEEFRKNFSVSEVVKYFYNGKLLIWLRNHDFPEEKCRLIEKLYHLYKNKSDRNVSNLNELVENLIQILEIPPSSINYYENIENLQIIRQILDKEEKIKKLTGSDEFLKDVERIACSQDELAEIIQKCKQQTKSSNIIYLLKDDTPYKLSVEDVFNTNLRFVGLNKLDSKFAPEIEIFDKSTDGKKILLEEGKIKNLRSEIQNKNKFNNLIIKARQIDVFDGPTVIDILVPKTEINSSDNDAYKTGMEIAEDKLTQYLDAGFPLIYLDSFEEDKADEIIKRAAIGRNIFEWSESEGLLTYNKEGQLDSHLDRNWSLHDTLKFFIDDFRKLHTFDGGTKCDLHSSVLVLKDATDYFNDSEIISQMRYLSRMIYNGKIEDCNLIIVSTRWNIPSELEHYITVLKINLTEKEIRELIKNFCKNHSAEIHSEILIKKFVEAFKGLSEFTIISILSLAFSRDGELNSTDMDLVLETKKQIIHKTNILEMVEVNESEDDIGGLENLKGWLKNKEKIFKHMPLALECGIKIPKGILIVGMPGCGKTLTAKVTAAMFNMPLLRLDMGRIFGKYVGESEKNMRRAIQQAEVISPCVLWIDELEKAFAGVGGDGAEVATRLFGILLTWMQEKTAPVFVVATANNISQLPPELLRKGRFDEIFYVGTPNAEEREKIFEIYISKVDNNEKFECEPRAENDLKEIVQNSLGFSSADIAGIIFSAVEKSFIKYIDEQEISDSDTKSSDNKKPAFSTKFVNDLVKETNTQSGWQQLKKIFHNYTQHDYKNASKDNMSIKDLFYWTKLRALYIKSLPGKIFRTITHIIEFILVELNKWAKDWLNHWNGKVEKWKNESPEDKKPLHFRFCRLIVIGSLSFALKVNDVFKRHFENKTVNLQKKKPKQRKKIV